MGMTNLTKTAKTMVELEIDLNTKYDWHSITEEGANLVPVHGPGYMGLKNLGNSCYMNSLIQVLFSLPHFNERFTKVAEEIFEAVPPGDSNSDLMVQLSKAGSAISLGKLNSNTLTVDFSEQEEKEEKEKRSSISLQALKMCAGRDHAEFSSQRQQDVVEYLEHVFDKITRANHAAKSKGFPLSGTDPSSQFLFEIESRYETDKN